MDPHHTNVVFSEGHGTLGTVDELDPCLGVFASWKFRRVDKMALEIERDRFHLSSDLSL